MVACAVTALVALPSTAPADVLEDGSFRLTESGATYQTYGQSVAMVDDLLLVGSPRQIGRGDGEGQAILYQFIDGDWQRIQTFMDSASWSFGTSVDMDADRIVISSPAEDNGNNSFGAVYVYVRGVDAWTFDGIVQAEANSGIAQFGLSISVDGSFLAVGEPAWDDSSGGDEGRASIWRLGVNGSYFMLQTVEPDQSLRGRGFGWSIELEGNVLAVGGPSLGAFAVDDGGRAWIFRKSTDFYEQESELAAPDAVSDEDEHFGYSVALDGTRVLVGRPGRSLGASQPDAGSLELFVDDGTGWVHEQQLTPQEPGPQRLGTGIDIAGGRLVAGMPGDAEAGEDAGAVAIYERLKTGWEPTARIVALDGQQGAEFGHAVSMDGERVAVGAPSFEGQSSSRAVYIYDSVDGWQYIPPDPEVPTLFADSTVSPTTPVDGATFGFKMAHDGNWGVAASSPSTISFLQRTGSSWNVVQVEELWDGSVASVAIDQDWAVVGVADAKFEYMLLFERDGAGTWSQIHWFANPNSSSGSFAATVDLNRNNQRVVAGSPGAGVNGLVHTYALLGGTWQLMTIDPDGRGEDGGGGGGNPPSQLFGQGLDFLGGAWLAVGAPGEPGLVGKVYLYNLVDGTWNLHQLISDPGVPLRGVSAHPMFGQSISLDFDGTLFIGAPSQSLPGGEEQAGCVHRFVFDSAQGLFTAEEFIVPFDSSSGSMFGWALDRSGDQLVISEPLADDAGLNAGRLWLYEQFVDAGEGGGKGGSDGVSSWIPVLKLVSDGPIPSDALGYSVSLADGDLLASVVSGDGVVSTSGRIKVFQAPFRSMWTGLEGGSIDDPNAWVPVPPSPSRSAVFSTWGSAAYDVFLGKTSDVTTIWVGLDTVTGYPAEGGSVLGSKADPISFFVGCPPDLGTSGVVLAQGTLLVNGNCTIGRAQLDGSADSDYGDLSGAIQLVDDAMLTVDGSWNQSKLGLLSMTVAEGMTSRLLITDTPTFAGTLAVQGHVADLPVGTILPLIDSGLQSGPLVDRFDLAVLPGLSGNRAFILHQGVPERGSTVVWLEIIDLADLVNFDDGDPYAVGNDATAVLVEDLDDDGYQEVAVVLGGSPGSLMIFRNDQSGGLGTQDVYALGNEPAGIAAGDFDNDGDVDLAVSNFADDTVDILRNDGTGTFVADAAPLAVGAGPLGLGARDLDLNGTSDLLVCCSDEREIQIYSGASLRGSRAPSQKIPTDGKPGSIDPADYDKEKGGDVGATTEDPGMILTMSVDSTSGELSGPQGHPSGPKPGNIKGKDVDDDGKGDFVASDDEDGTVTVLKQSSSSRGYDAPLTFPVADSVGALTLLDFDQDGDQDIAVAATLVDGSRVAKLLRNDTDLYGGSILVFTDAEDLVSLNEIQLVASGDLDRDGIDDLVTIGERIIRGDGASTLDVYRNPSCTGDVNADLVVDILDLLEVIGQWGACDGGCTADIDGNGKVDILDLLEVIGAWGACSSK